MNDLRERIAQSDPHFATTVLKFYYMEDSDSDSTSGISTVPVDSDTLARLQKSKKNVMIETLPTGQLGLPVVPHPVLPIEDAGIQILHPTILLLTKINRWSKICDSTRPKTRLKAKSDSSDIDYMLNWLAERELVIILEDYSGQPKENLLRALGVLRRFLLAGGKSEVLELLRKVMQAVDWVAITEEA
ncbi:hypothetical protein BDZ89DRAFT_1064298 [Hymenopellis radicata]|nr:hypothetical protein BDZ89DRAFT_1064298 [Hymenopellis radicata]